MKFSIKDLVTFTEEIFNGKLHVLCRVWACFRIFHELLAIFRVLPNILSVSQKAPSYMDDLVLNKHQVFLLQFILWWWKVIANNDNNKKRRAKSVISLDFLVINFRENDLYTYEIIFIAWKLSEYGVYLEAVYFRVQNLFSLNTE